MNTIFKFQNFNYKIDNLLTPTDISLATNEFYIKHLSEIDKNMKFVIIFKVETSEGDWRNISSLQTFDSTRIDDMAQVFKAWWSIRSDTYKGLTISKLTFRFRFLESDIAPLNCVIKYPSEYNKQDELLPEGYTNLPNNRLFESWGDDIVINGDNTYIVTNANDRSFIITQLDNEYFVTLMYKNIEILSFHDVYEINDETNNTFIRTIGKSELYYLNGNCNFIKQHITSNYIKPKNPDIFIKDNFLTMDLETRTIDNVMHVISASIYDGYRPKTFYLLDYDSSDKLIMDAIQYLLQRKYNGYRVYMHNLKFDMTFMLRILANMEMCEIKQFLKKDSKIISINVNYNLSGKRKYNIHFRDSLLLLPSNLRDLGSNFSVGVEKTLYPYRFVNKITTPLDYVGEVPSIKYFENTFDNEEEFIKVYNNYCKTYTNNWSLRKETIKYCENDVILLYLILKEFQIKIFKLFEADINKYPTLSSLAFAIYRMKYLNNYKIPIITGEIYKNLKKSYTGGSVDVYKPVGENVYRYDVNSLYPAVMSEFPTPVGKITKFKGDILKYNKNPFGFFYVNIKTPENIDVPILQTRVKTDRNGMRTISPLGEWSGWYFSEEIFNAQKHGYDIEIIWGYLFEKEFIFKDYVKALYDLKKNSKKHTPDYTISKLLLNSLYGRFGMSPDKETNEIIKGEDNIGKYLKMHNNGKINIKDIVQLDVNENIELISYSKSSNDEDFYNFDNINVAVASSITANARIKMSKFKIKYANSIYYTDTDSIDLGERMSNEFISNELGDFKLEHVFKKVIYVAPKVYAAITENSEEYVIIKGYKDKKTEFKDIYNMINKNQNLELTHEKWYQDIGQGQVITKEQKYTLTLGESKRKLVYKDNKLSGTTPYTLKDGKLI